MSESTRTTIQDHPDWQDGDFTLISSDEWRFTVPSYIIAVFRDAPSDGIQEVHFTDKRIERKPVLERFLGLAVNAALTTAAEAEEELIEQDALNTFADLIAFLQKYDCPAALKIFAHDIITAAYKHWIRETDAFVLGMLAGDEQLCKAVLASAIDREEVVLPHQLPPYVLARASPNFVYAMCRLADDVQTNRKVRFHIIFGRYLDEAEDRAEYPPRLDTS